MSAALCPGKGIPPLGILYNISHDGRSAPGQLAILRAAAQIGRPICSGLKFFWALVAAMRSSIVKDRGLGPWLAAMAGDEGPGLGAIPEPKPWLAADVDLALESLARSAGTGGREVLWGADAYLALESLPRLGDAGGGEVLRGADADLALESPPRLGDAGGGEVLRGADADLALESPPRLADAGGGVLPRSAVTDGWHLRRCTLMTVSLQDLYVHPSSWQRPRAVNPSATLIL